MLRYRIKLERDDGAILVSFPDFPGVQTFGEDRAEALAGALDALETMLMGLIEDRQSIPRPRRAAKGRPASSVVLPALTEAKIELYTLMREQGIGKAELARRLQCHLPQIDRLLDLEHASRLDQLEQAFAAVGKRLEVAVADAA
jgi:antitoxin HicB